MNEKIAKPLAEFLKQQKMLDLNMTIAQLHERISVDHDEVAGYTFAWDKYVYKTANIGPEEVVKISPVVAARLRRLDSKMLNMNVAMNDLIKLAQDTKIDQVAGYIYTEDRYTFIVASMAGIAETAAR